jgi:hypothetical protein
MVFRKMLTVDPFLSTSTHDLDRSWWIDHHARKADRFLPPPSTISLDTEIANTVLKRSGGALTGTILQVVPNRQIVASALMERVQVGWLLIQNGRDTI